MKIEEFLLARNSEAKIKLEEMRMSGRIDGVEFQKLAVANTMMTELINWHEVWPILVEGPMEFSNSEFDLLSTPDIESITYRVSRQMAWLTQAEYRRKFGIEPPAAPLLKRMAMYYTNHPDYNEEWRV